MAKQIAAPNGKDVSVKPAIPPNGFPANSEVTAFVMPYKEDANGNPVDAGGNPIQVPATDVNGNPPEVLKPNVPVTIGPVAKGQAIFVHYKNKIAAGGGAGGTSGIRVTTTP